jgi:hypothetical protein
MIIKGEEEPDGESGWHQDCTHVTSFPHFLSRYRLQTHLAGTSHQSRFALNWIC